MLVLERPNPKNQLSSQPLSGNQIDKSERIFKSKTTTNPLKPNALAKATKRPNNSAVPYHQRNKTKLKIHKPNYSHNSLLKHPSNNNPIHLHWNSLLKPTKRASTRVTSSTVWDTLMEHFIIDKAVSISASGNKTKWMARVHCIIQTMKSPTMATGKTISCTATAYYTMNKWVNSKNPSTTKTGPWLRSIG